MTAIMALVILLLSVAMPAGNEPVIGGPCEGCQLVFSGIPKNLTWQSRIAPKDEPGEPLVIEGTVRNRQGKVVPGVVVYAYQTDAGGVYPRASTRHGRLRGWALTDGAGRYRFDTIRPGSYPTGRNPQHVHMHLIEPGKATYYIADLVFTDDPYLDVERERRRAQRGGDGVSTPVKDAQGVWRVRRDMVLRLNVPE